MCGVWSRSRQIACRLNCQIWLKKKQMVNDVWDLDCSWFLLVVPAGRLCGSYWSAYGFFCLPCSILFVIAASIIGPQTPLDLEQ
ncbi:hypothetical protein Tco_0340476 [Tanacetum coccineum]